MKTPRIEEMVDWEKKVLSMRGYNHLEGEAYIVLEEENEIWDSEVLKNFIHNLIQKAHQAGKDEAYAQGWNEGQLAIKKALQDNK